MSAMPKILCFAVWISMLAFGCGMPTPTGGVAPEPVAPVPINPEDFYLDGYPTELSELEPALAQRYSSPKTDDFERFLHYAEAFLNKTESEQAEPDDDRLAMIADGRSLLFSLYYSAEKKEKGDQMLDAAIDTAEKIESPAKRGEVFLRIARTAEPIDALTRRGNSSSRFEKQLERMERPLRISLGEEEFLGEKADREKIDRIKSVSYRVELMRDDDPREEISDFIQNMRPEEFSGDRSPYRFPDTKVDMLRSIVKKLVSYSTHENMEIDRKKRAIDIAKNSGDPDYLKNGILPLGDFLMQDLQRHHFEQLAGLLEPDERLAFLEHALHAPANPTDCKSRAIDLMFETLAELPDDFTSRYLKASLPLGSEGENDIPARKRELQILALRARLRIGRPDEARQDIEKLDREIVPEDVSAVFETPEKMIDFLEIARCLTQAERDLLKRHPEICEAIAVVNRRPRYTQLHRGPYRCGSLKDITIALAEIGEKDAALAALRMTHKAFADIPMLGLSSFFTTLQIGHNHNREYFTPEELFSEEFLDDLIARCHDDFSDNLYRGHYEDGNDRFQNAMREVVEAMKSFRRLPDDALFPKCLRFIARIPSNKTCRNLRESLFFELFRSYSPEKAAAMIDDLPDDACKKEFFGYLDKVKEYQIREGIRNDLINARAGAAPKQEDARRQAETATDEFKRSEALFVLAIEELDKGNIEQAVKLGRQATKIYADLAEKSEKTQGPAYRYGTMSGIVKFYSKLVETQVQNGKYEQGIDFLLEGAEQFPQEIGYEWKSFLVPPLKAFHSAVKDDAIRTKVRNKLKKELQSAKNFKTDTQSRRLRAVLETQIALGFEEDAVPVLKTVKCAETNKENMYRRPLWDGMTLTRFQLRCGLFDEAMKTYSQTFFADSPPHTATSETDRTFFLRQLVNMEIARNRFDHAEKIIESVRQEHSKALMRISLARAYQKAGDARKALDIVSSLEPATYRPTGILDLIRDLSDEKSKKTPNPEERETLIGRYCEEVDKTEDPLTRYRQFLDIISLLYWNGDRDRALEILKLVDSPYHAAWILLEMAAAHEKESEHSTYSNPRARYYQSHEAENIIISYEYSSPEHYLDIAATLKSVEQILAEREKNEAEKRARRERPPFEPDKAAMQFLLQKALDVVVEEKTTAKRAEVLGAVGKMEYVYFSGEDAKKHFIEALELLKSAKIEPNSSPVASQLAMFFTELGENEKSSEAIRIAIFGNDPDVPESDIDVTQAIFERLLTDVPKTSLLLEELARNGSGKLAATLFTRLYEHLESETTGNYSYMMPQQLATIRIIALYHDRQKPDEPMTPQAEKQYRDSYIGMIRRVNDKREGYEKDSALQSILFGWANCEKRIKAIETELENPASDGSESLQSGERHLQMRHLGYENSFREFGNPFYREPVFYE